jgi:hypothetical protein
MGDFIIQRRVGEPKFRPNLWFKGIILNTFPWECPFKETFSLYFKKAYCRPLIVYHKNRKRYHALCTVQHPQYMELNLSSNAKLFSLFTIKRFVLTSDKYSIPETNNPNPHGLFYTLFITAIESAVWPSKSITISFSWEIQGPYISSKLEGLYKPPLYFRDNVV